MSATSDDSAGSAERTVSPTRGFTIIPVGDFSLAESALFGFGQRPHAGEAEFDGVMRLAFCLDDFSGQVGVELRQDEAGVHAMVHGAGELAAIERQVARVLSLDQDARSFAEVGRRDPVIGALQAAAPGLRPPLFYSPYEATVWSVLSARRPGAQMATARAALSEAHGASFDLAGQRLAGLPTPSQLLAVADFPGIDADRLARMHGVARAALDGLLDVDRLRALDADTAMTEVQRIKGIGPFYATLIVIRATGCTDVLAANEPRLRQLIAELYQLPDEPTESELQTLAETWRPWRTWTTVLLRAAGPRVLAAAASAGTPTSATPRRR
jgi:DNA-3-methyladenine glycosylase II